MIISQELNADEVIDQKDIEKLGKSSSQIGDASWRRNYSRITTRI